MGFRNDKECRLRENGYDSTGSRVCPDSIATMRTNAFFRLSALFLFAGIAIAGEKAPGLDPEDWIFLDNGIVRVGVIKSAGGAVGWLSRSGSDRNWVNHYDRGRLIQQSYYGDADGSLWVDKPWRLNPVQGGSYQNEIPPLLEIKVEGEQLYSKSIPLHWATGEKLEDFLFEQWIELDDDLVRARFRMTYSGKEVHKARHQEIPAVFLDSSLSELLLVRKGELERHDPGQRNEYFDIPEHWAAFVGDDGVGVGVHVPSAEQITAYRFKGGSDSDCSYVAPIATFDLRPGLIFEYKAHFFIGSVEQMKNEFEALADF